MKQHYTVLDGAALLLKAHDHSLMVLWDLALLLDAQVALVTSCACYQLRLIYWRHHLSGKKDIAMVTHAPVKSKLDYCNVFYVGLPLKLVQKLQLMRNAAASCC